MCIRNFFCAHCAQQDVFIVLVFSELPIYICINPLDFTPFPIPGMRRCFSAAEMLGAVVRVALPNALLHFSKWDEHLKTLVFTA